MVKTFRIGEHPVGTGRCYIIAEAGVNHNGDPELAHQLIDAAADARADAVKFQTFDPAQLAAPDAPKADYQTRTTEPRESQLEMLRKLALRDEVYPALKQHAEQRGLEFLSTAFDEGSYDFLQRLGLAAIKIGSGDMTNHPLLARVAKSGRPVLLSTGMATLDEVDAAVAALKRSGAGAFALFHCVSNYPAGAEESNLRAIGTLRERFGVPTGWSDHTLGITVSLAAAALGADLLEKHFTLDRSLPGPDHAASLLPGELANLVAQLRVVESARGTGKKVPNPSELAVAAVARKSLHSRRAIAIGQVIHEEDVVALRPGTGIPPSARDSIVGRRARLDIPAGRLLSNDDVSS